MGSEAQSKQAKTDYGALEVFERMVGSANRRDIDGLVAYFSRDFQSEEPCHPERNFVGKAGVRKYWAAFLQSSPTAQVEVLSVVVDGDTVWSELYIRGALVTGATQSARGVAIQRVRDGLIIWARLYFETLSERRAAVAA
jgi:ketosteroid isomerase-like protein